MTTEKQKRIVACARGIIVAKGMERLTTREIAKELKITDGALYRHFKGKGDILDLLVDDIEETLMEVVTKASFSSKDPIRKLENIFKTHLSYAEQRKGISFIIINQILSIRDKRLQRKVFGVVNRYLKVIKIILKEGVAQGQFRKEINVTSASIVFFGMVQSMVTIWGLSGHRLLLNKSRLEETFSLYRAGIGLN